MPQTIELPLLGLLKLKPMHGYELRRRLESVVGFTGKVSYGSLYPMLQKLEQRGQVKKTVVRNEGHERIAHHITAKGEARFTELMGEPSAPLLLKMLFFQDVTPSLRRRLLEQQRDEWTHRLEERRRNKEQIAHRSVDRYRAALLNRAIDHLERDIAWIQELIEKDGRQ
jgi:DNA-binding PadR family transcriptional regulator